MGHAYFAYLGGGVQNSGKPAYSILARSLNTKLDMYRVVYFTTNDTKEFYKEVSPNKQEHLGHVLNRVDIPIRGHL